MLTRNGERGHPSVVSSLRERTFFFLSLLNMMLYVLLLLFVYSLFVDDGFYLVKEVSFLFSVS